MTDTRSDKASTRIFISYSHKDADLLEAFVTHLGFLKRQNLIQTWHDRRIYPGEEWKIKIDDHIFSSQIILLLISPDFIDSDYCYDKEMTKALKLHKAGHAKVVPIILRPTKWENAPFGKLQALPTGALPVTKWDDRDDAFLDIVEQLSQIIPSTPKENKEQANTTDDGLVEENIPNTRDGILEQMTVSLLRFGLLSLLEGWPENRAAPNLSEICRTLDIRSRKSAYEALQYLLEAGLVERVSSKKALWRLSERGRNILERLRPVAKIRIDVKAD